MDSLSGKYVIIYALFTRDSCAKRIEALNYTTASSVGKADGFLYFVLNRALHRFKQCE